MDFPSGQPDFWNSTGSGSQTTTHRTPLSCVTTGRPLHFAEPQCPHLKKRVIKTKQQQKTTSQIFVGLWWDTSSAGLRRAHGRL